MIFNERLRRLRKERGLTQVQTAEHLSIAWRNYQRLEKDGNAPSFLTFVKAAEFFGVSLDYLAGRTDAREVNRGTCPPAGPEHRIILEAEVDAPDTVEPLLRGSSPPPWRRRGWTCPVRSTCSSPTTMASIR